MSSVELLLNILNKYIFSRKLKLMFMLNNIKPNFKNYRIAKLYGMYNMSFQIFLENNKLTYKFMFNNEGKDYEIIFESEPNDFYNEITFKNVYKDFVYFLENICYKEEMPKDIKKIVSRIKKECIRG